MAALGQTLKRLFSAGGGWGEKASATSNLPHPSHHFAWLTPHNPQWTNRSYQALLREGYQRNAVVYRAVKMIAECAASITLSVERDGVRIDESPIGKLIKQPNPMETGASFMERFYADLQLAGNVYLEVVSGADGSPAELYLLRPDRMSVVPGSNGWPKAYDYKIGGQTHRFPIDPVSGASNILHIKNFHPLDDHYGLSPMEAAAQAMDINNSTADWNKALLDNAARPSGALVFEPAEGQSGVLTDDQIERLKAEMREQFQGSENAGRPFLLEGGLKWQSVGFSPIEVNRRTANAMKIQYLVLAQLLAVLGVMFWERIP